MMLTTTLNTATFYSAALPVSIWYSSYCCCKSVHTNSRGQSSYNGDSTSISDHSVHEQASNIMPHLNTHTYIPKMFSLAPGPNCLNDVTGMSYTGSQSTSDDGLACLVWWSEFIEDGPLNSRWCTKLLSKCCHLWPVQPCLFERSPFVSRRLCKWGSILEILRHTAVFWCHDDTDATCSRDRHRHL